MFDFLYQLHEVDLFIILCGISVIFSALIVFLVNRFIPLKLRYAENPVLGNMSALLSIIYGVLAGLAALYLVNTYGEAAAAVQHEANAVANIYRDSQWLKEPVKAKIQAEIKTYLKKVVNVEWPLMQQGMEVPHDGNQFINNISNVLRQYTMTNNSDMLIMRDMLDEIKILYNARQDRIAASYSELNPEFWVVIFIGTILTVMINYLYGMHFYLHLITVGAATVMAFSMVFLLVTLDRPFQGEYVITPDAFKPVLRFIEMGRH